MIHQYKLGGLNIVLDVCSGAVHLVDDIAYDIIAMFESESEENIISKVCNTYNDISKNEVNECYDQIKQLKEEGSLFVEDNFKPMAGVLKEKTSGVIKALCLHVAHICNLNCEYCFASQGKYNGDRGVMSFETGKRALDFLIENSGTRKNLEVDFFGGEPLMNWEVVKQLVEYGRSIEEANNKKFRFTLTTNGVLLNDEILEFANKEMGNLVLSIDGRREINDFMRPTRNGKGSSYDIIVPKFKKAAESREQMNYYVRGTYTHYNTDFCEDVLHLADLGFEQISVEPVVAPESEPYALTEEDLPVLFENYDKLAKEMLKRRKEGRPFNFFHFMIDLSGGPCVAKRLSGCGSGCEYLAVTPWGDFYPCHQFVGEEEFLMGNVDEGIKRNDIREMFSDCNVYAKDKCKNCFAKFYCSGGCAANSYHFHGHINDAYDIGCELQKKRIECAIMMEVAKNTEEA